MIHLMRRISNIILALYCSFLFSCSSYSELYLIRENGKWGYINRNGTTIVKPVFENCCIERQEDSCCSRIIWPGQIGIIKLNNRYGAIDNEGKIRIQPKFDFLDRYHNSLIIAKSDDGFGVLNLKGDTVFPFIFDNQFISCNSKTGNGQINGKLYLLDFAKRTKTLTNFDKISYFSEGFAAVKRDNKYGFINESGKIIIEPIFQEVWPFNHGLSAVKINYQWGFIDTTGKFIVDPKYDETQGFDSFNGKYAIVVKNKKYGLIDRSSKFIISPKYQFLFLEDENVLLANIMNENERKTGLINLKEQWLTGNIKVEFGYFGGYVKIMGEEGYGMYKLKNGKTILPCIFEDIIFRSSGLTMVVYKDQLTDNQYFAYVNKKGKLVWAEEGFDFRYLLDDKKYKKPDGLSIWFL